jgi:disulfide bond formation protein DsbB
MATTLALGSTRIGVRAMAFLLGAASGAMLLAALYFQYVEGLAPCPLCIDQRYAHGASLIFAWCAAPLPGRPRAFLLALAALAFLAGAAIAGFHAGVEQHWWAGLASCTGEVATGLSLDELKDQLLAVPPARCDEIPWSFLGLSMAAWNGLISLALAGFALIATRKALRG